MGDELAASIARLRQLLTRCPPNLGGSGSGGYWVEGRDGDRDPHPLSVADLRAVLNAADRGQVVSAPSERGVSGKVRGFPSEPTAGELGLCGPPDEYRSGPHRFMCDQNPHPVEVPCPRCEAEDDEPKPWHSGPVYADPEPGSEGWHEDADCAISEYVGWSLTFGARMTISRDRERDEETGAPLPEEWSFHLSLFDRDNAAPCTATVHKTVTRDQVRSYAQHLLALVDDAPRSAS